MLQDYYKRFNPAKNYEQILFRAGKGLQSAELNDLQDQVYHQIQGVADAILKDGDVVEGGDLVIDIDSGAVTLSPASIYLRGQVRTVAEAQLVIATDQLLDLGVWLSETVVTELEDVTLRDPAVGTHNADEPGAGRLQVQSIWGLASDGHEGNFYPVYRVDNGVQVVKQPPPQLDSMTVALARYDREANGGSYVVSGLGASYRGDNEGQQLFSLEEGKAHIGGYEIAFHSSLGKAFAADPDLQTVMSEPHRFEPAEGDSMRIDLAFGPVHDIRQVDVTIEVSKTVTHGSYAGVKDPLPDTAVLEIVSVKQSSTTFTKGSDYKLTSNQVDWSLGGNEPAPGSSYTVVYQYRTLLDVTSDETGFEVSGVVPGTLVLVDYQWKMPRIDVLTLDSEGVVRRVKGVPNAYQPMEPMVPDTQLSLAKVTQTWFAAEQPQVEDMAVRSVPMASLGQMQSQISQLYELLAIERLRNDANADEPASKLGVFVDPFLDDDMRDQGQEQTAAIIDGELLLPVDATIHETPLPTTARETLSYQLEPVLEQPMQTGSMKVNPYQAFEPIPAEVELDPGVDNWTVTSRVWSSPVTRRMTIGSGLRSRTQTQTRTQVLSVQTQQAEFLRQREVEFELRGFGPGEALAEVSFDGVTVIPGAIV